MRRKRNFGRGGKRDRFRYIILFRFMDIKNYNIMSILYSPHCRGLSLLNTKDIIEVVLGKKGILFHHLQLQSFIIIFSVLFLFFGVPRRRGFRANVKPMRAPRSIDSQ